MKKCPVNKKSTPKRVFHACVEMAASIQTKFSMSTSWVDPGSRHDTLDKVSKLVHGFWKDGDAKFSSPIDFSLASNTAYCATVHTCHSKLYNQCNHQSSLITIIIWLMCTIFYVNNKTSSGDEIAKVNFFTTTSYMQRPTPTPIESTS